VLTEANVASTIALSVGVAGTRPGRPDHVYLSDFGLSKGALSSVGLTGSAQVLGTPNYMAPEQIQGLHVDGRTDQYALACAAFELVAGVTPFQRDQGMAVLWAHLSQPPPAVSTHRPGLDAADAVFAKALAKIPDDRYASCGQFADALRLALGLAPYDTGPHATPVVAANPRTEAAGSAGPTDRETAIPADHADVGDEAPPLARPMAGAASLPGGDDSATLARGPAASGSVSRAVADGEHLASNAVTGAATAARYVEVTDGSALKSYGTRPIGGVRNPV
jgi:serine/threonine protein kinase